MGMSNVTADDERLIEKHILSLFWSNLMPLPILLSIRIVPFKARALV